MKKTGIFGGSFNPIHNGHISLARQLREQAGLDEVWLMVSPQNPLKQRASLLSDELRLTMARLALKDEPHIEASDYEMQLPLPSYTWHTLQALSRDYPDREFVLMMGGDNWQLFNRWYHYRDILDHYRIVVYPRRDAEPAAADERKPATPSVGEWTIGRPLFADCQLIDISSTEIRRRLGKGEPISGLVPPAVEEFIMREGLYA
ncbi:MAG: nicotinate-nucleotide adenylyltransferase [Prevotella sp.]|nr:nicotinate-nucleotide adenylyltransferase [Prevotella sp.]